jgi:hypothetical protein
MIDRLFLKYIFSLAPFACSYFTVIPSDPSVSTVAYSNCRTILLLSEKHQTFVFLPRMPGAFYKDPDIFVNTSHALGC